MVAARLAHVLSVAGALALGIGAASATGIGPIAHLDAAPVGSVLGDPVSSVTQPVTGSVGGAAGGVAPAITGTVQGAAAPLAPVVHVPATRPVATTATTPPPPGNATAKGAHVNPLDTCVSCTGAGAQSGSSQSGAQALRVLGQPLSGGGSSSAGSDGGNLVALPANPLMTLAIAGWMTSAEAAGGSSSSRARSGLVDLGLANGQVATVAVLEAASETSFDGTASHGSGSTNGVHLTAADGALVLVLLHSEATSDGGRSAYLASLNGSTIGGSGQDGDIPITVPGVITIHLLSVGAGGGVAGAAIGTVDDVLTVPGEAASVLSTTAAGAGAPVATVPTPVTGSAGIAAPPLPAAGPAPRVPLTGISIGAAGLALLAAGLSMLTMTSRRRGTPPAA